MSHAQVTHAHSNTAAIDPAASVATPPPNTMQELRTLAIPNENVNNYLDTLSTCTPVNVTYLKHELQYHLNATFVSHLIQGFQQGFPIGFEGPRAPCFSKNLKSAAEHPDVVSTNLVKEVKLGRTAGPFIQPPFPNFQVYPIGVVPKKHSSDWRTIFHLSYPKATGTSVNDHIPKDTYSLQYVKIDDAIKLIAQLGRGSYMAKTDICAAFRNVPVHPKDWELLGMHWNGLYFFDTVLPFGLRSAPYIFNQLSDAIKWIAKTNYDVRHILHILDDFFLIEPPPRANCMTSLCKLLTLMTNLNVPIAPNKTYAASTTLEFLGVLLDSQKMIACLPPDKLARTKLELRSWQSKKSCTFRELQSLIGTLQFACRVLVPGRAFLQRMINLTCGIREPHHHIKLNSSFQKDVAMWLVFLDQWDGSNIFLDIATTHSPTLEFSTDASGSLGYGAIFNNLWFQGAWSKQFHAHPEQQSIAWKELFPVYLACQVWGPLWSDKRIILWCDNVSVTHILNTKSSKVTKIIDLVRNITLQTLTYNFTLNAQHVPGLDNSVSDALSRFQMQRFRQLAPQATEQPTAIPESLIQV